MLLSESAAGINLSYNFSSIRIGLTWSENRFSLPLKQDSDSPEKLFSFSGETSNVFSVYYNSIVKKILLYGEISANDLDRYAIVQGLSLRPSDRLIVNFRFWNYSTGYTCFSGRGPGGSTGNYSEKSLLGNFTFEAARHLFVSGGFYIQQFPWLKYRCSSPSLGVKREIGIKYLPSDKISFDCIYSYRYSMVDNAAIQGIPLMKKTFSRSSKIVIRYAVQDNLTLGTRFDFKTVSPAGKQRLFATGRVQLQDKAASSFLVGQILRLQDR